MDHKDHEHHHESGEPTNSSYIYIFLLVAVVILLRFTMRKFQAGPDFAQLKAMRFSVPPEGGALQRMPKDSDGNI